ncbi:XrtA/PEP-CTERM system-associated ATPase [Rhodoferax sp. GW822-FHT02A01]|uniref:XrtA/PEP-CTERM system-associated ATPase n=1 Tax=Rhodoferax sp. GW822-FHT02A01 TaxID=3141537 RepID=UPI00315DF4AA
MYEEYYGLSGKPFQLNPDPAFYFASKQHRRASAYLKYGVQRNEGFIVITGDVGAGKTTIVRGLLATLEEGNVLAANLVTTQLDADDTLRMVGAAFGVRVKDVSKADLLMSLEAFFVNQVTEGKRCLLIVDEAQNLTPKAVEELRMLSNFQFGQQALLQTFLVGQPEFRTILRSPSMQQLRQRVTATCHLGPMDLEETQGYIEHRLHCVGAKDRPSFDAEAYKGIFEASGGIPRRINQICDRLLLSGYLASKDAFGIAEVNEVVGELQEEYAAPFVAGATDRNDGDSILPVESGQSAVDIDIGKLQLKPALGEELSRRIGGLGGEQLDARMRRLERSVLHLERINLEVLVLLQKLVTALAKPKEPGEP